MQIVRVADMPEDKRKELAELLVNENIPEPAAEFNDSGLRYDIKHLDEIGGAISLLPLENMANYVDVITKAMLDNEPDEFIKEHKADLLSDNYNPKTFGNFNATSIGNIAYIVMHCKDDEMVKAALDLLDKYSDWYMMQLQTQIKANA